MPYAENTSVSPEKSRYEIERVLSRYGADGFMSGWTKGRAQIEFMAHGRRIRFVLDLPTELGEFRYSAARRTRTDAQAQAALEQEQRRRWRALALAVKAKLEVVETGISTFEAEFAMNTVLPDGRTAAEHVLPMIEASYASGRVAPLAIEAS